MRSLATKPPEWPFLLGAAHILVEIGEFLREGSPVGESLVIHNGQILSKPPELLRCAQVHFLT
jgi:hypothetical protein